MSDKNTSIEANVQAEALLDRAFKKLRESVEGKPEDGFDGLFPYGLDELEIRVDVRLSETASASVDLRVKGRKAPEADEPLDYDEFDDPLLYEDEES